MEVSYLYILLCLLLILIVLGIFIFRQRVKVLTHECESARDEVVRQKDLLQQQEQLKSNFFARISHDLRTPLTLIQGNADSILRTDKIPIQVEDSAKKIKVNVKQMTNLVNDLIELSRMEVGLDGVHLKPNYIESLLKRSIDAFSSYLGNESVQVVYYSDIPQETVVELDESQFDKVLSNLMYNALQMMTSEGRLEIYSHLDEEKVVLQLILVGVAIPKAQLSNVFDEFYRSEDQSADGGGLGMILAKKLLLKMNGEVLVSDHTDGGVMIEMRVPIAASQPSLENELIGTNDLKPSPSQVDQLSLLKVPSDTLVMIVEDNSLLRGYLKNVLRDQFDLITACNGQEALDLLGKHTPDLILTDVMMPVMDGWELISHIREDAAWSKIPVIMLTAVAENSDRLKGLRLGVDDYIVKPFEVGELLIRIANVVGNLRERIKWAKEFHSDEKPDQEKDRSLVLGVRAFVKENIGDKKLNVTQLAMHLGLSERQLYRKAAQSVGMSPSKLITEIRLQHARELLVSNRYEKLTQIASEIGFESSAYFSKLYLQRFGKKPTDYFS